jgi:hypothetical protein
MVGLLRVIVRMISAAAAADVVGRPTDTACYVGGHGVRSCAAVCCWLDLASVFVFTQCVMSGYDVGHDTTDDGSWLVRVLLGETRDGSKCPTETERWRWML